jgi:hypothetical protein
VELQLVHFRIDKVKVALVVAVLDHKRVLPLKLQMQVTVKPLQVEAQVELEFLHVTLR